MNDGMRNSRLAKTGIASLMKEQSELLDQLKFEMEAGRDGDVEKDYIAQVMRGVENRMEDMKWPVRMNQRMDELDMMVKGGETRYSYTGGDRLDGGEDRIKEKKKERSENEYNERRPVEDIDQGERVLTPVDEDEDSDSEERRRKKRKKREKKRRQKEMERRRLSEEKPVPDPSVLAYVFNPFRMMGWEIPSVDNYERDIKDIEKKREELQIDIDNNKKVSMGNQVVSDGLETGGRRDAREKEDKEVKMMERKEKKEKEKEKEKKVKRAVGRRMNTFNRMKMDSIDEDDKEVNRGKATVGGGKRVAVGGEDSKSSSKQGGGKGGSKSDSNEGGLKGSKTGIIEGRE